jgi:hypothetical protein
MKNVLFYLILIFGMLAVSRFVFERLHLYDELIWLDIPMHLLGGFLLAGLFISILVLRKIKPNFVLLLSLFFIVASLWEIHEFFIRQVVERSWYGFFDTVKDYIVGALGVSYGYYVLTKKKIS